MGSNLKDILTTIVGVAQLVVNVVVQGIDAANGGKINWFSIGISVAVAVIGYFSGKNADGTTKSVQQVAKQADPAPK